MAGESRIFVDTSVLFSAIWSEEGGSRMLLRLGEAGLVRLVVSDQVLREIEGVLKRKLADLIPLFGLLINRSGISTVPSAGNAVVEKWVRLVGHPGDAQIVADAVLAQVDALVTLDKTHLLDNRKLAKALPCNLFSPAGFLAWFREKMD